MRTERETASLELVKGFIKQQIPTAVVTFSEGQYDHYDVLVNDAVHIEVKERLLNYSEFKRYTPQGLILEATKYQFLTSVEEGRYVNLFNINGVQFLMIWNPKHITTEPQDKQCRATTDFTNTNFKAKSVFLLSPKDAKIHILINDVWTRVSYQQLLTTLKTNQDA